MHSYFAGSCIKYTGRQYIYPPCTRINIGSHHHSTSHQVAIFSLHPHQVSESPQHHPSTTSTMGLFSKAALVGAGYYAYKHHQDKKKTQQRGEVDFSTQTQNPTQNPNQHQHQYQKRDLSPNPNNNYYPNNNDNKSQHSGGNADYYRDTITRDSRAQLEYPPQHHQNGNPSYSSFGTARQEYVAGAKY